MNRVMYREWLPQIVYNHHQTGPPGTVLFCPPFRDPFNYNFDPLVVSGIDAVGAAMMQRFLVEDKPGATTRSGARYSTWFNGGPPHHRVLPQHDRPAHRDHRQPDADPHPVHPRNAAPEGRLPRPGRAAGVALPPVGRVLRDREQGRARLRVAQPRAAAPQHLADGQDRYRSRQQGQLDGDPEDGRRSERREGAGRVPKGLPRPRQARRSRLRHPR